MGFTWRIKVKLLGHMASLVVKPKPEAQINEITLLTSNQQKTLHHFKSLNSVHWLLNIWTASL